MKSARVMTLFNHTVVMLLLCVTGLIFSNSAGAFSHSKEINFNHNWKFKLADNSAFKNQDHNDSGWNLVDVPHDYIFEQGVSEDGVQGQAGGYHGGGVAWYRKHFAFNNLWQGKQVFIHFDGVYMNSEVWLNGHLLGSRPYGYISFHYEITKYLKKDNNVISVRVDNTLQPSARWYHPGGIYAPVKLKVVNPTHIKHNSLFVSTPKVGKQTTVQTAFELSQKVNHASNYQVRYRLVDQDGGEVLTGKSTLSAIQQQGNYQFSFQLDNAKRWNPHDAYLYNLNIDLLHEGKVIDSDNTNFGVREIAWKTDTGFWINGKNVKIKGVSEHFEGGPVGGAWTKPLLRWKLQLLKDMGVNAVRLGHNPYPSMFYDLADELGIMLMDEIFDGWRQKARHDYGRYHFEQWWQKDITEWVTRNRNHPSIIIYSVGNETHGEIAPQLVKAVKQLDPTRMVTSGSSNKEDMEVVGVNGGSENKNFLEGFEYDKPFISTEAPHTWQTRGYYRTQTWWRDGPLNNTYDLPDLTENEIFFYDWKDPKDWSNQKQHLNSSYDNATVRISARKNWERARDLPYHSGHFRWTGFDYHGEAGLAHGGWPFHSFMGGALDLAGFKKDLFHFYRSQWLDEPSLHILPSWTHPTMAKGTKIPVWVYSNLDEVELFLNGKSLGRDKPGLKAEEMQCEWLVPWQPGKLTAVGYKNGQKVLEKTLNTAGAPVSLQHYVEEFAAESGFSATKVITSQVLDKANEFYPYSANKVYYHFSSGVKQKALENGSPYDHTNRVHANFRSLFMGKTRAFVEMKYPQAREFATIGAIIGDEALRLSNQVSIDVQYIPLTDSARHQMRQVKIFYTVNDAYATEMKPYTEPFNVENGDTVYAKVLINDKVVLSMEQKFGDGVGLFWGDKDSAKMWVGRGLRLQAEAAELTGAEAKSDAKWVHGGSYTTFNDKEGKLYWYHENDGEDGVYKSLIRYTHNDQKSKRPLDLYINNEFVTTVEFKSTGSWVNYWSVVEVEFTLVKGANHIELRTKGESGPNLDQIKLD
ncbi:glycoside hydrolase family 2 TIM barrel-domain containing protein [Catenovulum agarivorans]|uniref:glycoside hydrolase family 2 TIM barrel-domain containing protein n=1 Tax=Catenovulum agarivorans TaxID=1172192 RepID=UPI0002D4E1C0|nr:glycoside hydrolase family 2 TIM barrel-domain containing protein [Catenovulum agarivorans]